LCTHHQIKCLPGELLLTSNSPNTLSSNKVRVSALCLYSITVAVVYWDRRGLRTFDYRPPHHSSKHQEYERDLNLYGARSLAPNQPTRCEVGHLSTRCFSRVFATSVPLVRGRRIAHAPLIDAPIMADHETPSPKILASWPAEPGPIDPRRYQHRFRPRANRCGAHLAALPGHVSNHVPRSTARVSAVARASSGPTDRGLEGCRPPEHVSILCLSPEPVSPAHPPFSFKAAKTSGIYTVAGIPGCNFAKSDFSPAISLRHPRPPRIDSLWADIITPGATPYNRGAMSESFFQLPALTSTTPIPASIGTSRRLPRRCG
jgi:hypothetical protein